MVKVNIHQHQKGKPILSKKRFGPEATLIQYFREFGLCKKTFLQNNFTNDLIQSLKVVWHLRLKRLQDSSVVN